MTNVIRFDGHQNLGWPLDLRVISQNANVEDCCREL